MSIQKGANMIKTMGLTTWGTISKHRLLVGGIRVIIIWVSNRQAWASLLKDTSAKQIYSIIKP